MDIEELKQFLSNLAKEAATKNIEDSKNFHFMHVVHSKLVSMIANGTLDSNIRNIDTMVSKMQVDLDETTDEVSFEYVTDLGDLYADAIANVYRQVFEKFNSHEMAINICSQMNVHMRC